MATIAAAALLDQLMGKNRNCHPNETYEDVHWDDKSVCKYFLCGFCPHKLFTNTRADIGACRDKHDEAIRKRYQESRRFEKMGYENDFLEYLEYLVSDVDRRIRRGLIRLELNAKRTLQTIGGKESEAGEKFRLLTEEINELVRKMEELGGKGNVEEAQVVLRHCDQLRKERKEILNQSTSDNCRLKEMVMCEVCGAFLIVRDAPDQQDEHMRGKQHVGFTRIREEIEKLMMKKKQENAELLKARERDFEDRCRRKKEREDSYWRRSRHRRARRHRSSSRPCRCRRSKSSRRKSGRSRSRSRSSSSSGSCSSGSCINGCRCYGWDRQRSGSRHRRRSRNRSGSTMESSKSSSHSRSQSENRRSSSSLKGREDRDRRCKSQSKDRGRHSKSQSKDRGRHSKSQSKDRHSKSQYKDRGRHSKSQYKDRGRHSKSQYKDRGRHSKSQYKDRGRHSKSQSKDRGRHSKSQSKDRGRHSKSQSKDRGRHSKSQSKDGDREMQDGSSNNSDPNSHCIQSNATCSGAQGDTKTASSGAAFENSHV